MVWRLCRLRQFVQSTGIPFCSTQMGKGVVDSREHASAPPCLRIALQLQSPAESAAYILGARVINRLCSVAGDPSYMGTGSATLGLPPVQRCPACASCTASAVTPQ